MQLSFKMDYLSEVEKFSNDLIKKQERDTRKAALLVKRSIKRKSRKMSVTGKLAEGVYHYKSGKAYFVGIRRPGYHAYLIEFGHLGRDGKRIEPNPLVYASYQENADKVGDILGTPM